jgi:hypothetical protein
MALFLFAVDTTLAWIVKLLTGRVNEPASSKRWYVVHAYSGFEKSVQRALLTGSSDPRSPTSSGRFWCRSKKSSK